MRLYIIRHGQRADREETYDGGWNPPLSEAGRRQATLLAEWINGEQVHEMYSSPMLRSMQTAAPLHRSGGFRWHVWPVFCETSRKRWDQLMREAPESARLSAAWNPGEALPSDSIAEQVRSERPGNYYLMSELINEYPGIELDQPFPWPDAWWTALAGQTAETGFSRVALGLNAIRLRHDRDDRVAIVAHGNCGDVMISYLLGLSTDIRRRFHTGNSSVACVELDETDRAVLLMLNSLDHLPDDLRV